MKAFVMLTIELGAEKVTCAFVRKLDGIHKVVETFGAYDAIVEIEAPTEEDIRVVLRKIRGVNHIRNTLTIIGMQDG